MQINPLRLSGARIERAPGVHFTIPFHQYETIMGEAMERANRQVNALTSKDEALRIRRKEIRRGVDGWAHAHNISIVPTE
jgi:hypothetical protein